MSNLLKIVLKKLFLHEKKNFKKFIDFYVRIFFLNLLVDCIFNNLKKNKIGQKPELNNFEI